MSTKTGGPVSSSGMDKKIEKKTLTPKRVGVIGGTLVVLILFVYSVGFISGPSTLNIDRNKLTISTVREGSFQKYIRVRGTVKPIQTIYLDAIEGGMVEEIYQESGAMVEKGDTILTLSNSDLRLTVLQRSSAIYDQINQTRNSRLNIEQNTLSLKERLAQAESQLDIARADYRREKHLFDKDLVAEQKFRETKENYEYQKKRHQLIYESFKKDSIKSKQQIQQIDQSLERMWRSLEAVQKILDRLVVTAPLSGQLSTIELNPGQAISSGERIGQVDILDKYKIRVGIDEYYLSSIRKGLKGSFTFNGDTHQVEIAKVYPVVKNGQFKVDMEFVNEVPSGLTRGQTVRIRLELGDKSETVLLSGGGFYQATGGDWIYKLSKDGKRAVKQEIQLGRQNPQYFEVVSGIKPGDKVITSGYESFGDNEVLSLE